MKRALVTALVLCCIWFLACRDALANEEKLTLKATASSVYSNSSYYAASNAVDGNISTYWLGGYNASPWWIMFDAAKECDMSSVKLTWYSATYTPSNFDIQVSTDGLVWKNVYANIAGAYSATGFSYSINRKARYLRLYIRTTYYYPVLRECEAYGIVTLASTIRFQGTLKDVEGTPLEGARDLTFRLYKEETGGLALWEETHISETISGGLLDVELGSVRAFDIAFDAQYWLGVEVDSDGEMMPRFKLSAVPYAIRTSE